MEKVSIIVPIYKAEKYLSATIDSIVNQTYTNLEIILVVDGSPDKSKEICYEYAEIDKRIIVINNKNRGVSYSRNCGIKISTGKYILFIDSDDIVDKAYVEILVEEIKKKSYDLVVCGFYNAYEKNNKVILENNFFDKEEKLTGILKNDYYLLDEFFNLIYIKIYKTDLIKKYNIGFPLDMSNGEDHVFNYTYYKYIKTYKFINKPLYYYFIRDKNSLSKQKDCNTLKSELKNLTLKKVFFYANKVYKKEYIIRNYILYLMYKYLKDSNLNYIQYSSYKRYLLEIKKEISKDDICVLKKENILKKIECLFIKTALNNNQFRILYYGLILKDEISKIKKKIYHNKGLGKL